MSESEIESPSQEAGKTKEEIVKEIIRLENDVLWIQDSIDTFNNFKVSFTSAGNTERVAEIDTHLQKLIGDQNQLKAKIAELKVQLDEMK